MSEFEFDPRKSASNREKHGIDFVTAQRIWADTNVVQVPAASTDEPRFMVVGKIDGRHWSAIATYRLEVIRIISVRRSREIEVRLYESS